MRLAGARVAITGASGGIGEAAALAFAREGARLALAARRREALEQVAERCRAAGSPEVLVQVVDVTIPPEVEAWAAALTEAWGGVEVCVANAGVGHYGTFAAMKEEHLEALVQTNLLGVWRTTQALLPLLAEAKGHVVVVGSIAGRVPLAYLSTYVGTKHALVGWTRSVRPELARMGITITHLAPGATRTGFARNSLRRRREGSPDHAPRVVPEQLDKGTALVGQSAARVGRAVVHAARWRRREVHLSLAGIAAVWACHVAPLLLARLTEPYLRPRDHGGKGGAGNWKH
jgi:short-subunit dehydrogenase